MESGIKGLGVRTTAIAAFAVASLITLSACASGSPEPTSTETESSVAARGDVVRMAFAPPSSLDPSKATNGVPSTYMLLAYAGLIEFGEDGSLVPGLAASWEYVDDANKVFELTLKPDLVFADGTSIDADAVVASLEHFRDSPAPQAPGLANTTIEAVDGLTVRITSSVPNPSLAAILSPNTLAGAIISPAGLANPDALGTQTFGAGPYVLNLDETITGDNYFYDVNPNYWNAENIHYDHFQIKAIPTVAAQYQALQNDEVDIVRINDALLGEQAKAAGFQLVGHDAAWGVDGIQILDQGGVSCPALGNEQVRQAANYAIDRKTIVSSIYGDLGQPTSGFTHKNWLGYSEAADTYYTYDPKKAQELLAESGVADPSFTLSFWDDGGTTSQAIQAMAQNLEAVGIHVDLKPAANLGELFGGIYSGAVCATQFPMTSFDPFMFWGQTWQLGAGFNPFDTNDPEVVKLFDTAAAAPAAEQQDAWAAGFQRLVERGWDIPLVRMGIQYIISDKLDDPQAYPISALLNFTSLKPKA